MSIVYRMKAQFDKAIAEGKKAIELDPNGADTLVAQGDALRMADRPEEALRLMERQCVSTLNHQHFIIGL